MYIYLLVRLTKLYKYLLKPTQLQRHLSRRHARRLRRGVGHSATRPTLQEETLPMRYSSHWVVWFNVLNNNIAYAQEQVLPLILDKYNENVSNFLDSIDLVELAIPVVKSSSRKFHLAMKTKNYHLAEQILQNDVDFSQTADWRSLAEKALHGNEYELSCK